MNLDEQIEDVLSKYGDYYHIGDGNYECRDTGHVATYAAIVGINTTPARRKPAPASAKKKSEATTARNLIKPFGYCALKRGTPKQKAWAEKIRSEIVKNLTDDVRSAFTDDPFNTSKFWIDNREKTAEIFAEFARRDIELGEEVWTAHNAEEYDKSSRLRKERDELQAKFGI